MHPCIRPGLVWLAFALGMVLAGPRELIASGRYEEAYREAQGLGAEGLVWAARAANLYATYLAQGDETTLWFTRAEQAATQALKLNPRSAEAHFELARAQGGAPLSAGSARGGSDGHLDAPAPGRSLADQTRLR